MASSKIINFGLNKMFTDKGHFGINYLEKRNIHDMFIRIRRINLFNKFSLTIHPFFPLVLAFKSHYVNLAQCLQ